jgi:uncharacterized protein YgiM (DUF1202 family)/uncharacterized membrane protein YeaQ/YmgE (transglycosylase-associated protein family)
MVRSSGRVLVAGILVVALIVSGCATQNMGQKQKSGMAIGALAGGLAGSFFGGSDRARIAAIAAGVIAGATLGNYIGSILDEQDQQAVMAESVRTLSQAPDGHTNRWSNPESGASAAITTHKTEHVKRSVPIIKEKYVASPGELVLINAPYRTLKNSNVRTGPGTDYKAVNLLQQGEVVTVVGQVKNRNWYMVGRDGRSIGYVYTSLLTQADTEPQRSTQTAKVQEVSDTKPEGNDSLVDVSKGVLRTEALDLDDIEASMDLESQGLVAEEVVAETEVRTVTVQVENKAGQSESNTFRASRGGDGVWEVI